MGACAPIRLRGASIGDANTPRGRRYLAVGSIRAAGARLLATPIRRAGVAISPQARYAPQGRATRAVNFYRAFFRSRPERAALEDGQTRKDDI